MVFITSMETCKVCGTNYAMGKSSRNYVYHDYCSRYCYEFDKRGLSKVTVTIKPKTRQGPYKNVTWPAIEVTCQTCAQPFDLIKHNQYGHSQFCSVDCRRKLLKISKRSQRDYHFLLPLYESKDWMSAADVAEVNKYRWTHSTNSSAVANILKLWYHRGILDRTESTPYNYRWNSDNPTVKAMIERN